MTNYVLGFAFNQAKDYVVLINKNKPEWQKGSLNGVGGKIEAEENAHDAMAREFKEETGVKTNGAAWQLVGTMAGPGWNCTIFTMSDDSLMAARTMEEEEVSAYPVQNVIRGDWQMITNVPFLIELCRDENRPATVRIIYAD